MAAGVRFVPDVAGVTAILTDPEARAVADEAAAQFASTARGLAAHRTGAGAASIAGEPGDGAEVDVTWDAAHHYMFFQEFGTKYMPAHPALTPALDRYAQF